MALCYQNSLVHTSHRVYEDPVRGMRQVDVYQGTPAAIVNFIPTLSPLCSWETDDSNAPMWILTVNSPDTSDLRTTFEISGQDLSRSIYEHPDTIKLVSRPDQNTIKEWFRGAQKSGTFQTDCLDKLTSPPAWEVANMIFRHQDSWPDSGYVLRQRSVGLANVGFPSLVIGPAGTGLLFAPNDLMPGGVWNLGFDLITQDFINAIEPEPVPAKPAPPILNSPQDDYSWDFMWAWLCGQASQTDLPGGRVEFRQEWKLSLWSHFLYFTWQEAGLHAREGKAAARDSTSAVSEQTKPGDIREHLPPAILEAFKPQPPAALVNGEEQPA